MRGSCGGNHHEFSCAATRRCSRCSANNIALTMVMISSKLVGFSQPFRIAVCRRLSTVTVTPPARPTRRQCAGNVQVLRQSGGDPRDTLMLPTALEPPAPFRWRRFQHHSEAKINPGVWTVALKTQVDAGRITILIARRNRGAFSDRAAWEAVHWDRLVRYAVGESIDNIQARRQTKGSALFNSAILFKDVCSRGECDTGGKMERHNYRRLRLGLDLPPA